MYEFLNDKINSVYDDENASSTIICHLVEEIIDYDKYMKDTYNYSNKEVIDITLNDKVYIYKLLYIIISRIRIEL